MTSRTRRLPERAAATLATAATAALCATLLAGCGGATDGVATGTAATSAAPTPVAPTSGSTGATSQPPLSASAPSETELSPGWDERPDGASAAPDATLDDAALTALLRTRATAPDSPSHCRPDDVRARLEGFDAAAGHRYTYLVVRNVSRRTCVLEGIPGLGARGSWGHRLTLVVHPGLPISDHAGPARLAPGASAEASLEWTGELAGNDAERASMLVVQLADGQTPVRVAARLTGVPAGTDRTLDIGMLSTVSISPFEASS